jgi:multicomponent Na+:H+ antiporter subunit D
MPLLSAVVIPVAGYIAGKRSHTVSWYITLFATAVSFFISLSVLNTVMTDGRISYHIGGWEPPWGIEYVVDYLSAFVLVIVSFISFVMSVYAKSSIELELNKDRITAFYSIYMLFVTGLMGIVITGDIFNLYVFLEISSLAGYALVAVGRHREAVVASYNYLILGTVAATFILLGVGYLYMATGTLNMADLRERLPEIYSSRVVLTAFAFFTVGLSLKLALFPLHAWLPNAYTYAPSVVSAVMSAVTTKVGAYALFRIMFTVFKVEFSLEVVPVASILIILAFVAIIVGSVLAISQTNIKRMLAYSSVAQIGYIVLGAAIANQTAMTGGLMHILNHALMKGALFLVVGIVIYRTGIEEIAGLKGMGKKLPLSMAAFTVGGLSMIGIPLTVGFVSKWYIAIGALMADMWYLIPVIIMSSLLTAVYFWRIIDSIYFQKAEEYGPQIQKIEGPEAPAGMLIPTVILAGLCIFFGIAAFIPVSMVQKAVSMLLGGF